jgi:type IV pilus assembly protein PilY1
MRKALAIVQIISIVLWNTWSVRLVAADDSDIFGNNVEPNVLILLDTSGSMEGADGTITTQHPYDPAETYSGSRVSTTVYRRTCFFGNFFCTYNVYASSISDVNSSSAQTALSTVGYWSGSIGGSNLQLFVGNYVNYANCSSCQQTSEEKIDIAKRVITNMVNNVDGVRFGVMRFNTSGTMGQMVSEVGTDTATIISAVNAIDAVGNTPLGEQMDDAGRYFKGQALRNGNTYTSPIQYSCQPNFIIVISDGEDNGPLANPVTEATNRYTQDHSTYYTGSQNVIVHTVGFSLNPSDASEKQALSDLQQMATNGGGTFYTADNSAQLEHALQDAISQIMAATFSFATPTIPTTATSGATRAYLASFQSNASRPFWRGYLKAYNLVNGTLPVDSTTGLPSGTPVWDAGQQLSAKTASSRTVKTYASSALQDFTTGNSAITTSLLNASNSTEKDQIINYIRGATDYNDEDADNNTSEERPWKLGDIFHSTPVLVSPPFSYSTDSSYNSFKTTNASRTAILLAGANDGMLHAFRESDGEELWAFIPPNLLDQLKNLKALSGNRDYFVDASPIVADVKTGGSWKTIAIFGERRGGNRYYALDITNTSSPQYLWSFSDSNLGETWSEPAIGKVRMSDSTDKWVAFIGAGFDSTHANYSTGNKVNEAFFAIDLSNGTKVWEYYNATGSTDDRQYMNFSMPAAPTAVDLTNDGYIDRVYIGDVGGQLWKFDVAPTGGAAVSGGLINNWTGKRLFAAASSQANPPPAGEYYPVSSDLFSAGSRL